MRVGDQGAGVGQLRVLRVLELLQVVHRRVARRLAEGSGQQTDNEHVDVGVQEQHLVLEDGDADAGHGVDVLTVGAEQDQGGEGRLGGQDVLQRAFPTCGGGQRGTLGLLLGAGGVQGSGIS